jgi:tRNA dimethylallyltransferase
MEGMLKEIEQLRHEYDDELLISLGLEYKHITKFLKGDYTSLSKTIELLANDTYHYAKRQITWNKKYLRDAILIEVKE